jgi:hypothetical protein
VTDEDDAGHAHRVRARDPAGGTLPSWILECRDASC